jgi:hypothetical protein
MSDGKIRPLRRTIQQAAGMLNVSTRTVRRMLGKGDLKWSGNQVLTDSIYDFAERGKPAEETPEEIEAKLAAAKLSLARGSHRRVLSKGIS